MNRQDIEQNLKEMKFSHLAAQEGHQRQLKAAIFEYATKHKPSVFSWAKDAFKNMSTNFKISSFVAGTLVGVLVLGGVQAANNSPALAKYNPFATPTAQAKAQVKDMLFKARMLTPEERETIDKKMKADMQASLEEAYAASDLEIITGPEAENMGFGLQPVPADGQPIAINKKFEIAGGVNATSGGVSTFSISNPTEKIVKQLRYTDPQGRKVTLGVGENGFPIFKMVSLTDADLQQFKVNMQNMKTVTPGDAQWSTATPSGDITTFPAAGAVQVSGDDTFNVELGGSAGVRVGE